METKKVRYTISGLDRDVIRLAKASAALQGIDIREWWENAAREKLEREKSKP